MLPSFKHEFGGSIPLDALKSKLSAPGGSFATGLSSEQSKVGLELTLPLSRTFGADLRMTPPSVRYKQPLQIDTPDIANMPKAKKIAYRKCHQCRKDRQKVQCFLIR